VLIACDPGGYLSGLHGFRTGELARWVTWFTDVVHSSATASLQWADEVDAVLSEWRARLADLRADAAARKVVEILPAHPVVTAATAAALVNTSDTAARVALDQLHARGIVEPYAVPGRATGRPRRWWLARDLAELVRV
jgi:hypothetical protein